MWDNTEHPAEDEDSSGYSSWLADLVFFAAMALACCTLGLIVWTLFK